MRYAFLDKLAEDGDISRADRDQIYDSCSDVLTKVAFRMNPFREKMPTLGEALAELGRDILQKFMVPAAIVGSAAYGLKKLDEKVITPGIARSDMAKLLKTKVGIINSPDFALDRAKASARFDELMKIAPAVALKPNVAKRLVADRLHSGFTPEDAQRLIQMQATYEKSPFTSAVPSESIAARMPKTASALSSAQQGELAATIVQLLGEASFLTDKTASLIPWKRTNVQKTTDVAKEVLRTAAIVSGFGALIGVGAGAINTGASLISKKRKADKIKKSYMEAMRRSDPATEPLHANEERSLRAFQTLAHFSPNTAMDPEAARAFMLNLVNTNMGAQTSIIKDLANIEKDLKQSRPSSPFLTGLGAGLQHGGFTGAITDVTKGVMHPFVEQGTENIRSTMGY
jgi:hypothetical protein